MRRLVSFSRRALPVLATLALIAAQGCSRPEAVAEEPPAQLSAPETASTLPAMHASEAASSDWILLIHGGAGVIRKDRMTAEKELAYREGLEAALAAGAAILREGGSALDAVEAAVVSMEDNPNFNAGRGAVLTSAYEHELDASIMDGRDRDAGAVAGVTNIRNPIRAARSVMEDSPHVMFAGKGAEAFAAEQGLATVEKDWFTTPGRLESLERVMKIRAEKADKRGTVGAVALDASGNLAAATSTGGMTAKAPGRVGDAPIIGAGTYADNESCAVSATGHGEYFIRVGVARMICARIAMEGLAPEVSAMAALDEVAELGGDGGVIVLTPDGEGRFAFNTEGMFRGVVGANHDLETGIYGED